MIKITKLSAGALLVLWGLTLVATAKFTETAHREADDVRFRGAMLFAHVMGYYDGTMVEAICDKDPEGKELSRIDCIKDYYTPYGFDKPVPGFLERVHDIAQQGQGE